MNDTTIHVTVVQMEPRRFEIFANVAGYHYGSTSFSGTRAQAEKAAQLIKAELRRELGKKP